MGFRVRGSGFTVLGDGQPLVLIPGLQGRWEYQSATVEALARFFRVITFSLDGTDLDSYADQVARALDDARADSAIVCGISFGGLIALRFASRYPSRCSALVLANTPQPALTLRARHRMYVKLPWILGPLFILETPFRVWRELRVAIPTRAERARFCVNALRTFLRAPVSIGKMAGVGKLVASDSVTADCARIAAPTLILTGEPHLDHVVPVAGAAEYERLIPHARRAVLESTGHLGSMTRPGEFAAILQRFGNGCSGEARSDRGVA